MTDGRSNVYSFIPHTDRFPVDFSAAANDQGSEDFQRQTLTAERDTRPPLPDFLQREVDLIHREERRLRRTRWLVGLAIAGILAAAWIYAIHRVIELTAIEPVAFDQPVAP